MCCFSGAVRHVADTQIFARPLPGGRQVLAYAMTVGLSSDVAMVLPLPVPAGAAEDAVRFVDLSGAPRFFHHLGRLFVDDDELSLAPQGPTRQALAVHDVGAFEASFVPTPADFDRLDARFRMPRTFWSALPAYADFGFAVFKLRGRGMLSFLGATDRTFHPMALELPVRDPTRLFFPTVHVHDGEVHAEAAFDHTLYCQGADDAFAPAGWERSALLADLLAPPDRAPTRGSGPVFRRRLEGMLPNADTWVPLGGPLAPLVAQ